MRFLHLLFAALILNACLRVSSCSLIRLNGSKGSANSHNYPRNYNRSSLQRYVITANSLSIITLKFLDFHTEGLNRNGRRTDFLRVFVNEEKSFLYGNLTTPFYLVFRTTTIRMRFISNNNDVTFKGFNLTYTVIPTINGNSRMLNPCNNIRISNNAKCISGCPENWEILEDREASTCVDGSFLPLTCVNVEAIRRCENNNFENCPYTLDEIITFLEKGLNIGIDPSFTPNQMFREQVETFRVLANIGKSTSNTCSPYCRADSSTRRYAVRNCSSFEQIVDKVQCIVCRFRLRCRRGFIPG